ncbi:MAG: antitoxin [Lachnospiraceae bacterium]|nr:antitoxin [Lachnospiraceae bacterium]
MANNKYNNTAYDRIAVNVRKGERERLKEYAAGNGESVSGLVNRLLAAEVPGFDPITEK